MPGGEELKMGKRCPHKLVRRIETSSATIAYQCVACLANGVRPLGPSNDGSPAVRLEIDAAERLAAQSSYLTDICDDVWDVDGVTLSFADSEYMATAWAWRIDRPLAEQLAETAADDAAAD